jgi:hypothetical protein
MPKITNHEGPTIEGPTMTKADAKQPPVVTPADELRARGKLGPYTDAEHEVEGDGTGEPLPPIEETEDDDAADTDDDHTVEDDGTGPEGSTRDDAYQRPATNAPKADWVAYAEAVTGTEVDESTWTKAQLIDEFGAD